MLRRPGVTAAATTTLSVVAFTCLLAWLQFSDPRLFDGDSYFHTRAAQQLAEHGIRAQFPQAEFSTWKERYSDKDFLFHALLIPFCRDEATLRVGGKWAAVCFSLLVLGALALTLVLLRIPLAPVWILLFLSSGSMLHYLLKTRPHLLAMALFPIELLCLLSARWKTLGVLSALHTLSHSSFVLLPGLSLAQLVAHSLRGLALPWRGLIASVAGVAAATAFHPYFPNNLSLTYDQVVEVARSVWWSRPDVPQELFGRELLAMPPAQLALDFYPVWLPLLTGLVLAFTARARAPLSVRSLTLCGVAAGFLALSLLSARFAAFFAGLTALAAGSVWSDLAGTRPLRELWRSGLGAKMGVVLVAVCLVAGGVQNDPRAIRERLTRARSVEVYRPAVAYLDEAAQAEEQVYHNFWWAFSWLYHLRPDGRYVVGLDPIFLYRAHPERFRQMLRAYSGQASSVYDVIARDFQARWVFVEKLPRTARFRGSLRRERRIVRRYNDRFAEVYEVVER